MFVTVSGPFFIKANKTPESLFLEELETNRTKKAERTLIITLLMKKEVEERK